jgi:UrcA family protein
MTRLAIKILLLGGFAGIAAAGAAGASPASSDAPALTVRFNSEMLATDSGARALYRRLARAAEQVCPPQPSSSRLIPVAVANCREQAIAGAVNKIHNQRLAAVHAANSSKSS